jgi:hypothetical protein
MSASSSIAGEYTFTYYSRSEIPDEILQQCAALFSNHYGIWDTRSKINGRVKLTSKRLKSDFLFNDTCSLVIARTRINATAGVSDVIVGYAIYTRYYCEPVKGYVGWVTQLCVDSDHRSRGIAKSLCKIACKPTDQACGIVSSHPYAVRALERATGRQCSPELINQYAKELIECSRVPYVQGKELRICSRMSSINTQFPVDHSELLTLLEKEEC